MTKTKIAAILMSLIVFIGAIAGVFTILNATGSIHMMKNEITLESGTYTKVYDGLASDASSVTLTAGTLYEGDTYEVSFIGTASDCGTYNNKFDVVIKNKKGKDVTSSYSITKNFGTLTITSRPLTIRAESETSVYDGSTLRGSEYEIVSGELVSGQTLDVSFDGEISDVGETSVSCYAIVKNEEGKDVTSNYRITTVDGTLAITKIELKLTSQPMEKYYDGTELKDDSTEPYEMEGTLAEGDTLVYTPTASITNVGTVYNDFDYAIRNSEGNDVTSHYSVTTEEGSLTIQARTLSVKSKDHTFVYKNQAVSYENDSLLKITGLQKTDTITPIFTTSVINVGEYENRFTILLQNAKTGDDVSSNYNIKYEYGVITITPLEIEITTPGATKVYDGTLNNWYDAEGDEVNITEANLTDGYLLTGHDIVYETSVVSADAGVYDNAGNLKIVNESGQNVTRNYEITLKCGTLTIEARQIVLKASSASMEYDSENPVTLTSPEWYLLSGEMAPGEYLDVKTVGSISEVGSCVNDISYNVVNASGAYLTSAQKNYEFEIQTGLLTIYNKASSKDVIYIAPKDLYMKYTGNMSVSNILQNVEITGFESYENDTQSHQYDITAEFEIQTSSGSAFSDVVGYSGSFVLAIKEDTIKIMDGDTNATSRFEIHALNGALKLYVDTFGISTDTLMKYYDGTPLSTGDITMSEDCLVNDSGTGANGFLYKTFSFNADSYRLEYQMTGSITEPGIAVNGVSLKGLYKNGSDKSVLGQYYIAATYGTLTLKKKSITIVTGSKTVSGGDTVSCNDFVMYETYDKNNAANCVTYSLPDGFTAVVKKNVTISVSGTEADNALVIQILDSSNNDVTDTYFDISYVYGKLILDY